MKNNTWAVWGPLRLGALGPGPAGPLDKTALSTALTLVATANGLTFTVCRKRLNAACLVDLWVKAKNIEQA